METYTLPMIIEKDPAGYYAACHALQGGYTQGTIYEESLTNIRDAVKLHLMDRGMTGYGERSLHPGNVR